MYFRNQRRFSSALRQLCKRGLFHQTRQPRGADAAISGRSTVAQPAMEPCQIYSRIVKRLILDQDTTRENRSGQLDKASWRRNLAKRESMMSVVVFTGPNGTRIAINSEAWQTVVEDIGGAEGARTQIGFAGAASAIHVRESCDEVIQRLREAEAAQSSLDRRKSRPVSVTRE
jgi:hypothetical protein